MASLPPIQQPPLPPLPQPSRPAPCPHPAPLRGDRKQKKRDQNKSAALRYRRRKRAEGEALEGERQGLEARNRELRERAESVEREIQYVKDLLIEVYKARSQRTRSC
nr:cyclic AMP-dependent transcription factor ATF-5-like [Aotus nancymaae]